MFPIRIVVIALIAAGHLTSSQSPKKESPRVVIVGAGVAGYMAAMVLKANNITDLVVLEASDRVGGRIHTVEFGGHPTELGVEHLHGKSGNFAFELANEMDMMVSYMPLVKSDKILTCDTSGNKYNSTLVDTVMQGGIKLLDGDLAGSGASVADFFYPKFKELLATYSVEPELGEAMTRLVTLYECANTASDDLYEVGAKGEAKYVDCEGNNDFVFKPESKGFKTIFDLLSNRVRNSSEDTKIEENIVFGKEVQRIVHEEGSGEVVLSCADGSSYRADHVIVTVSLGVLKKHAADMFQPPLPQTKTDAIRTLGIGCVGRVFLLFPTRWWPSDINVIVPLFSDKQYQDFVANSTHGYWTANSTGFWPVMNNDRVLTVWFSGQSCRTMEQLTEEQVTEGLLELLNRVVGQSYQIPKPEAILKSDWSSYNYTLGAYSFPTVESDRLNVTRQQLAEPVMHGDKPVLMFAGEAVSDNNWGTVHGAMVTGRHAAKSLLDYILGPGWAGEQEYPGPSCTS